MVHAQWLRNAYGSGNSCGVLAASLEVMECGESYSDGASTPIASMV